MRFSIGDVFKTKAWGRITVIDIHPAILQIEQESGVQFWTPFDVLQDEISGNQTDEEPKRKLPSVRRRLKTRRPRSSQETDSVDNSETGNYE